MARLRHTARKSVIPFLPSRLTERPLRHPVTGQSSHLKRLHHCLHEEQEHRRQELEQQGSSFSRQREVESVRSCSPVPPLEAPPAPPLGVPVAGVAVGGDPNVGGDDSSSSHNTDLLEEQEPKGWVVRPITRDAARGCHIHDVLDTLLCQALDRHTWSIEYRCVVFQQSRGAYPDRWEATCLVRRPENNLWGVEACSEHYSISEQDSTEVAMQDATRCALSHYCSVLGGVADDLDLRYYPRRLSGSIGGMVVSPIGEDNPRLSSTVNLAVVLNTELDHALDQLSRARVEIAQFRAECAECHHLADGSPAPVGTQHPYHSPQRGQHAYDNPRVQNQDKFGTIGRQCWIL
jgi:hypothetical protein